MSRTITETTVDRSAAEQVPEHQPAADPQPDLYLEDNREFLTVPVAPVTQSAEQAEEAYRVLYAYMDKNKGLFPDDPKEQKRICYLSGDGPDYKPEQPVFSDPITPEQQHRMTEMAAAGRLFAFSAGSITPSQLHLKWDRNGRPRIIDRELNAMTVPMFRNGRNNSDAEPEPLLREDMLPEKPKITFGMRVSHFFTGILAALGLRKQATYSAEFAQEEKYNSVMRDTVLPEFRQRKAIVDSFHDIVKERRKTFREKIQDLSDPLDPKVTYARRKVQQIKIKDGKQVSRSVSVSYLEKEMHRELRERREMMKMWTGDNAQQRLEQEIAAFGAQYEKAEVRARQIVNDFLAEPAPDTAALLQKIGDLTTAAFADPPVNTRGLAFLRAANLLMEHIAPEQVSAADTGLLAGLLARLTALDTATTIIRHGRENELWLEQAAAGWRDAPPEELRLHVRSALAGRMLTRQMMLAAQDETRTERIDLLAQELNNTSPEALRDRLCGDDADTLTVTDPAEALTRLRAAKQNVVRVPQKPRSGQPAQQTLHDSSRVEIITVPKH